MKHVEIVTAVVAAISIVACAQGPGTQDDRSSQLPAKSPAKSNELDSSVPDDQKAMSETARSSEVPSQARAAETRDLCALLSAKEVTEITGVPIERMETKPNGCDWYASPAVRQQTGTEAARGTFEKMSKQEPASFNEALRSVEGLMKGLGGAVAPDKPVFGVSVQWENADQAEAVLKVSVRAAGGGMPGGRLEPIEGLGDRAYMGPIGSFFYVRKGGALITMGLSVGTREQAIALAQRIVSRL